MKRIIVVLGLSLFLFTGCTSSGLKKSSVLVTSKNRDYAFVNKVDSGSSLHDTNERIANLSLSTNAIAILNEYNDVMAKKVKEINAAGGATGRTLTLGNSTIGQIDDLIDYVNDESYLTYDPVYVMTELISIRDNMKTLGFID